MPHPIFNFKGGLLLIDSVVRSIKDTITDPHVARVVIGDLQGEKSFGNVKVCSEDFH